MHEPTGSSRLPLGYTDEYGYRTPRKYQAATREESRARWDAATPPRTRPLLSLPFTQVVELPRGQAAWLYAACGLAAMAVGIYSSTALIPLFESPDVQPPLARRSAWLEEPLLVRPRAGGTSARDKLPRGLSAPAPVAKNSRAPTAGKKLKRAEVVPFDPNATPDMDLMDVASSPMEQRALAERRHTPVAAASSSEGLDKLDLLGDSGAETGTLHINSRPWSHVFVDDRMVGTTPLLKWQVTSGTHQVRLVNPGFGMSKTLDVTVRPGEDVTRVVSLDQ